MTQHVGELNPPVRLMLTPGPSSIDPRVYRAMATPLVGHMDPWFKGCMEETQILMRQLFQTENRITMPLSASGSGGIEASVLNSLEEGDEGIVAVNGVFSERMYEIATRASSKIVKVEAPCVKPVEAEDESAELVFRFDNGDELLGQRPAVSSHSADFADLCAARSDAAGGRRRTGIALGAASRESTRADRGHRGYGSGSAGETRGGPL